MKKEEKEAMGNVLPHEWKSELDKTLAHYHMTAAWVALLFNPVFIITDFINLPQHWHIMAVLRLVVSVVIGITIRLGKSYQWHSYLIVFVPFLLISFQNAFVYQFVAVKDLLGQNLNYIALFVGAGFFVAWHWTYSVMVVSVSVAATFVFVSINPNLTMYELAVNGGLLLVVVQVFSAVLTNTRFRLIGKELQARLALKMQSDQIRKMNENLEMLVQQRTEELQRKNRALQEYAFINAHKLRAPVASILGLFQIFKTMPLPAESVQALEHLNESTHRLDAIVSEITESIEKAD
jgi:signal transduction histidine kinase